MVLGEGSVSAAGFTAERVGRGGMEGIEGEVDSGFTGDLERDGRGGI